MIMRDNDSTRQNLIRAAQEAWDILEDEMLETMALGMQKRVDATKAARGWYTKY
jgi:hypothetical protein